MRFHRVLAISPHTDDVELAAGGTVARLVKEGAVVHILALSAAEESNPGCDLRAEQATAAESLGAACAVLGFPVRHFSEHRQAVLDALIGARDDFQPDLVLIPSSTDTHQDHEVVYREALRAFRRCTVLGYHHPTNEDAQTAQGLVELDEDCVDAKCCAICCYVSQANRHYTDHRLPWVRATADGARCGVDYAEAFEVVRWRWLL